MPEIIIKSYVAEDVAEAVLQYEEKRVGLGLEFFNTLEAAYNLIKRNPEIAPVKFKMIRRFVLRRFPYNIFYIIEDKLIVILGVFHAKKDPKKIKEIIN